MACFDSDLWLSGSLCERIDMARRAQIPALESDTWWRRHSSVSFSEVARPWLDRLPLRIGDRCVRLGGRSHL
jgi:hypothetical protein